LHRHRFFRRFSSHGLDNQFFDDRHRFLHASQFDAGLS
jgi:hypothetical protein